jgi:uroporphyrin-III C-methyltransferase/precorrin-2 dehydrogenase/sirohydrochlorin ferrochelatase
MKYLPIFIDLSRSPCLVVGAGEVARRKIETLLKAKARVLVVAKAACEAVLAMAEAGDIELELREFVPGDLDPVSLIIAATTDEALNQRIADTAHARRIPVNVVDNPKLCSFIMPSIVDRSPVVIAVSTSGAAPVLARLLRSQLRTDDSPS